MHANSFCISICVGTAAGLIVGLLSYLPLRKHLHSDGKAFFHVWLAGIIIRFICVLASFLYFIHDSIAATMAFLIPFIFVQEITIIFLIRKRNKNT